MGVSLSQPRSRCARLSKGQKSNKSFLEFQQETFFYNMRCYGMRSESIEPTI